MKLLFLLITLTSFGFDELSDSGKEKFSFYTKKTLEEKAKPELEEGDVELEFGLGKSNFSLNRNDDRYAFLLGLKGKDKYLSYHLEFEGYYLDEEKKFETYEFNEDLSRIISEIVYEKPQKLRVSLGRIHNQTLGYGAILENYSNDLNEDFFRPGITAVYLNRSFELDGIVANMFKPDFIGTRFDYKAFEEDHVLLGAELFVAPNAPITTSQKDEKPESKVREMKFASIDISYRIGQLLPFLSYSGLEDGRAIHFGVEHGFNDEDIKVQTMVRLGQEDSNYEYGYFDSFYEFEKYDAILEHKDENTSKSDEVLKKKSKKVGSFAFTQELSTPLWKVSYGIKNRNGSREGSYFLESSFGSKLGGTLAFEKKHIEHIGDMFSNSQNSIYRVGLYYLRKAYKLETFYRQSYQFDYRNLNFLPFRERFIGFAVSKGL